MLIVPPLTDLGFMGGLGKLFKIENNGLRAGGYQAKAFGMAEGCRVPSCHRHLSLQICSPVLKFHRMLMDVARNAGRKHVPDVVTFGTLAKFGIFTLEPELSEYGLHVIGVPLLSGKVDATIGTFSAELIENIVALGLSQCHLFALRYVRCTIYRTPCSAQYKLL